MHARKQAILTRSDPIPSLRPGIDTSKRKKWQRSIRQPAQQPASQPQRSRNAHHLARPGSGGLPQESIRVHHTSPGSTTRSRGVADAGHAERRRQEDAAHTKSSRPWRRTQSFNIADRRRLSIASYTCRLVRRAWPCSAPLLCARHCAKNTPRNTSVVRHRAMYRCFPTNTKLAIVSRLTQSRRIGAISRSHRRACRSHCLQK